MAEPTAHPSARTLIVMAKTPFTGRVKTRLIGPWTAAQAAHIHAALLECTLARAAQHTRHAGPKLVLALSDERSSEEPNQSEYYRFFDNNQELMDLTLSVPAEWLIIGQGGGDLGQRLTNVWRRIGGGETVFLGADSPDVPRAALEAIFPALADAEVALGPAEDGGYWVLAARRLVPALFEGIAWGTADVYDQTAARARQAGLAVAALPRWADVDRPEDLLALRSRIAQCPEPALATLARRLGQVCQGAPR